MRRTLALSLLLLPVLALAAGHGSPFAPGDLIALMLQFASFED